MSDQQQQQLVLLRLPLADAPDPEGADERPGLSEFVQRHAANFQPAFAEPEAAIRRLVARLVRPPGELPEGVGHLCLRALRLACRYRPNLEACPDALLADCLRCLLVRGGIAALADAAASSDAGAEPPAPDEAEVTESLMCLCNLCILFDPLVATLVAMRCHAGLIARAGAYSAAELDKDFPAYDLRLLFLLAAKSEAARRDLRFSMRAIASMTQVLQLAAGDGQLLQQQQQQQQVLSDRRCDLLGDLLKLLYALASTSGCGSRDRGQQMAEAEDSAFPQLAGLLRQLLLRQCAGPDKRDRLTQHCISLLLCLPPGCQEFLLTDQPQPDVESEPAFEGKGIAAIDVVIEFLDSRMSLFAATCEPATAACAAAGVAVTGGAMENLVPVLSALFETCRNCRSIRRYCKHRMLPKRCGDQLTRLPEEGTSISSRLCRILTHPCTQAADMAACLVHTLCKGNIGKCVGYTGYGNFAGFLARRGLMGGAADSDLAPGGAAYSPDSSAGEEDEDGGEDSDEEGEADTGPGLLYNPITGRREPPRPDPTAGMTEEQKEFEVHRMMQAIDRLQATGVISPAVIGEDGRPCPVSHPLELVDRLAAASRARRGRRRDGDAGDSDSSDEG